MKARQTIRHQLALIIATSIGIGLLLTMLLFTVAEVEQRRDGKLAELYSMAEIIAFNASAVVEFQDMVGAERLFSSLQQHPDIVAGRLRGSDSGFRYRFQRPGLQLPEQVERGDTFHKTRTQYVDFSHVTVAVPIQTRFGVVGSVALTASLDRVWRNIAWDTALFLLGSLLAFLVAFLVARRMQASLLAALGSLTDTANRVAGSKDFSQRASKLVDDEVGQLADAFNTMLTEIAERDGELARHREHLEDTVQQRTQALSLAKSDAELANRAKSTFLANMSHELRTPMNAIIGLTYMLQRNSTNPIQLDKLGKINNAATHLLGLLNDILDLSKIEADRMSLELTPFTFDALLANLESLTLPKAEAAHLQLACELDPRLAGCALLGDPLRLQQVLLNLVGNAIKFTEKGSVTMSVQVLEDQAESMRVDFVVRDTGIGITPEALRKIFNPFEQADGSMTRKYGGTGLGLPISQRLVRLMGAEIRVESAPHQGSTFAFAIQLAKAVAGSLDASDESSLTAIEAVRELIGDFAGRRILLAEDDQVNQEVALELLRDILGFTVDIAGNGLEVLELAQNNAYDLVLMDIQMPKMDGLEAARRLRQIPDCADLPIIAMTANAYPEDQAKCLAAGMNDFVAKPVGPDVLFRSMLKWLKKRRMRKAAQENSSC